MQPTILGVSASLRSSILHDTTANIPLWLDSICDEQELIALLRDPKFNLGKLSNSESALLAALWAAQKLGANIKMLALKDFFPCQGVKKPDPELLETVQDAQGIILSGPVYFGDRSSLAQDFIRSLQKHKVNSFGKIFSGISVGAKRNGGQETTLIYQALDMLRCGFLVVGNDSDTTSQYGGTVYAGTKGTMHDDDYGMMTVLGVGRRVARLTNSLSLNQRLNGPCKVLFLLLQEGRGLGTGYVNGLIKRFDGRMDATVIDVTALNIGRCLACDSCPKEVGPDEQYRCRIGGADDFCSIHTSLLDHDAIVPVVVSLEDQAEITSNYQRFIERTRYIRRGDYAWSDLMMHPIILEEPGGFEDMHIRLITSLIRHHTIVSPPMRCLIDGNEAAITTTAHAQFDRFLSTLEKTTAGRLASVLNSQPKTGYNPIGYILPDNTNPKEQLRLRNEAVADRHRRMTAIAKQRLHNS